METEQREQLALEAGRVFSPAVPVSEQALFAGRMDQIRRVVDAINQRGQHAVIFGERGVGKTSLANIIASKLTSPTDVTAPRINCDSTDDFAAVWRKVFSQVDVIKKRRRPGFQVEQYQETVSAAQIVGGDVTPDEVRRLLTFMGDSQLLVIILDEFDRLTDAGARRAVADTIKSLSDHDVPATVVVVGVADTVTELIAEHRSIERALVQVPMRRMDPAELDGILDKGTARLNMSIAPDARRQISRLSQGLPHYTHLLGLYAARAAIDAGTLAITIEHVRDAVVKAVGHSEQSLIAELRQAVTSPHRDSLYPQVLLACALARPDEFGHFAAADVRAPLSRIMGRQYDIPSFAKHLNEFCQPSRGPVLRKMGAARRFRYGFTDPLMQPLIVMKGIVDGRIDDAALDDEG